MLADVRTRFGFVRQDPGHQRAATADWRQSAGTINFVGEWHTHPEAHPNPSLMDRNSWKKQMRTRKPVPLVFLIGGTVSTYCGLGHDERLTTMARVS
jgi:integrative and conjugative element protein (TIGR02256 family)